LFTTAEWLGEYGEYAVQVQLNRSMALELKSRLSEQGIRASGITSFSSAVESPLRWGEAVPLWFIEQALKQQQHQEDEDEDAEHEDEKGIKRKTTTTTYIILSQPTRRIEPEQMAADLRRLGETISAFFEERTERAVVAISGDLAHTHSRSPDSPYPWSATAQPFGTQLIHISRHLPLSTVC
jgi:aromatic ring-opening dioxygenase LigB subunit